MQKHSLTYFVAMAFALLMSAGLTAAQTVTLTWVPATQPSGVTVTSFNIYRAPCTGTVTGTSCTEGAFAGLASVAASTTTYADTAVTRGASYSYYVTSVCSSCTGNTESAPSVHFAITVPTVRPLPPTLSITAASLIRNGANANLSASWTDTGSSSTTWTLASNGTTIASGTNVAPSGNFSTAWKGKINPNTSGLTFIVCDSAGCVSQSL